ARLAADARAHRASPRMWTFLTGPAADVRDAVTRGLRISMAKEAEHPGTEGISHGTHLVLVDGEGQIRAYYDPEEGTSVERAVRDAALLVNRGSMEAIRRHRAGLLRCHLLLDGSAEAPHHLGRL